MYECDYLKSELRKATVVLSPVLLSQRIAVAIRLCAHLAQNQSDSRQQRQGLILVSLFVCTSGATCRWGYSWAWD